MRLVMTVGGAGLRIAVVQSLLPAFLLAFLHFLGREQRATHFGVMMKELLIVVKRLLPDDLGERVFLVL